MAATEITRQSITRTGPNPISTASANADGNYWTNDGVEYLYVVNGGGSACVITLDIQKTVDGQSVTDPTVSVAGSNTSIIGPFTTSVYNDTNNRMNVSYSQVTSVSVAVLRI